MPFEFLDDITVADCALRAWGSSVEEMCRELSVALCTVMVENPSAVQNKTYRKIELEAQELEMLVFGMLDELIYLKDAENLLLRVESVSIERSDTGYRMNAAARGERIDRSRHRMGVDVKAVTLQAFTVEQTERGWQTEVVLDI
jgi:SHS2 domain-containing protein